MNTFTPNNGKKLLAVLISAIATGGLFGVNPAYALSPPNITTDTPWGTDAGENGIGYNGVADIMAAFNNARRREETQLNLAVNTLGNLALPSQAVWSGMSDDAKALFLINAERTARAGMKTGVIGLPLEGIESHVDTTSQNYANLLNTNNAWGHYEPSGDNNIDNPGNRINVTVGATCKEFTTRSENLAAFRALSSTPLTASAIPLPVERAIYAWIYDDASSQWGHREAVLLQDSPLSNPTATTWGFKNNHGAATHEGFLGFHVTGSTGYTMSQPASTWPYNYGVIVVMNVFDPVSNASSTSCGYSVTQKTEDLPSTSTSNTAPVASNDTATTTYETAVTISNVLANDTDANGDTLSVTANTNPTNGTVTRTANSFTYTPKTGFSGADSFTYTISDGKGGSATATVNVTVGTALTPVDAIDDNFSTDFNTVVDFNVVTNDSNPAGGALKISKNTTPPSTAGTLALTKTGTDVGKAKFTPKKGYSGETSFTYTLTDSKGKTDTATVKIIVKPGIPPTPVDDVATTKYGKPITFNLLDNDGTPKPTIVSNTKPQGTVSLNKTTGVITYTPKKGFSGTDTFNYTVNNAAGLTGTAKVTVTVQPNTAPRARGGWYEVGVNRPRLIELIGYDSDGDAVSVKSYTQPQHGKVSLKSGKYYYTPNTGYVGNDVFNYTVKDTNGAEGSANITLFVTATPSS